MESNSINPSEVATLSLLGGGGYGYGNGRYGSDRSFASDSSNAVRIESHDRLNSQGQDFLSQQISDNADRNRDAANTAANTANFNRLNDKIADQSARFSTDLVAIAREQEAIAREAAKCCCEAKLLAVENQGKTDAGMAQILANQAADVRVNDAVANARQNAKLDTLLADAGRGHGHGNSGN